MSDDNDEFEKYLSGWRSALRKSQTRGMFNNANEATTLTDILTTYRSLKPKLHPVAAATVSPTSAEVVEGQARASAKTGTFSEEDVEKVAETLWNTWAHNNKEYNDWTKLEKCEAHDNARKDARSLLSSLGLKDENAVRADERRELDAKNFIIPRSKEMGINCNIDSNTLSISYDAVTKEAYAKGQADLIDELMGMGAIIDTDGCESAINFPEKQFTDIIARVKKASESAGANEGLGQRVGGDAKKPDTASQALKMEEKSPSSSANPASGKPRRRKTWNMWNEKPKTIQKCCGASVSSAPQKTKKRKGD